MSAFPGSPRLVKGALIGLDPLNPLASIIVFQYNPETLSRSLQARASGGGARAEALRLEGPPQETIKLDVRIDAADDLEEGTRGAERVGIHPQLAALEMLLYPKTAAVVANAMLAAAGTIEVVAPEAPLTLFVWGKKRVLPVRLNGFSIAEEAHDPNLNPIRARASLDLRVLSTADFPSLHPGYHLFLAHQVIKEALATVHGAGVAGGV